MLYQKLLEAYKFYRKQRNYSHIPDKAWRNLLVDNNISPNYVEYETRTGKLLYKPFGVKLDREKQSFLVNSRVSNKARALQKLAGSKLYLDNHGELIIDVDDVKMIVETGQDLEIVHEIFLLGIYNFLYNQPCIAIDIGMNTGFASLFFAHRENVQAVYAYEPFKATYEQAIRNFALNPKLAAKIKAFDYGVGARDETIAVEFDYNVKGSVGISGIDDLFKSGDSSAIVKADLIIKPFTDVFRSILDAHPDGAIVAKIDCEGAEYEILDSLAENAQLEKIKIIMMEWHKKGPDPLVKHLQDAGFIIFSRLPRSTNVGTIYAIRP
jgi:FkbM family methyltransferase